MVERIRREKPKASKLSFKAPKGTSVSHNKRAAAQKQIDKMRTRAQRRKAPRDYMWEVDEQLFDELTRHLDGYCNVAGNAKAKKRAFTYLLTIACWWGHTFGRINAYGVVQELADTMARNLIEEESNAKNR